MSVNQFTIDKHKAYDAVKDEALCRHKNHESWTSICKDYGFDRDCFVNYLIKIGLLPKRSPRKIYLCDSILEQAYKEYTNIGSSISNIAKKYGVYRRTLTKDLKQKYNLDVLQDGKKQIDDHYFDIINSAEKAYWLGFLYADGYNNEDGKIELALQKEDLSHIEKFKKAIQSKHKISYKPKVQAYRISINSKSMSKALAYHGCVNHKSYVMDIPMTISSQYLSHFIRGYFDGDGSVFSYITNSVHCGRRYKYKKWGANIIATLPFCEKLQELFLEELDYKCHIHQSYKTDCMYYICFYRKTALKSFYEYMYSGATIWMPRKKQKWEDFLSACDEVTRVA